MKRILLSFAVITALLASCNMNVADVEEPRVKADSTAIGFGVYVNRGVSTKAGKTGELTTATLQEADGGFGVFGYYGNGALYNESSKPDFMYNEVVTYAAGSGKWEYHPVKYWPNEFGTAASSEAVDRLSFFLFSAMGHPFQQFAEMMSRRSATSGCSLVWRSTDLRLLS